MNAARMLSPGTSNNVRLEDANDVYAGAVDFPLKPRMAEERISPRLRSLGANSLVVAILSPFLVLASSRVQRVLLGVVVLDIPIQLGTSLFLRPDQAALGALKGLSISATTLAVAGLYASWFMRAVAKRTPQPHASLHFNLPLLFYLAMTALSVSVAQDAVLSSFEVFLLIEACLIYFYVANAVQTHEDVRFIVSLLMIGGLFESLVIIAMRLTVTPSTTWDFPIHIIAERVGKDGLMRIGGTIGVPNVAGGYLSIILVCAASLLLVELSRLQRWLAISVIAFGSVALIFTFSRGAWMAFVLAITLLGFVISRHRGFSLKVPLAILAILALLYLPFHNTISARLLGKDEGSGEARIPLNSLAIRMIEDNPVLGVGANNFTVAMDRYVTSEFRHAWLWAVHNKYLLVLAETGFGGLLAYLAFLLSTLRRGWQCWRMQDAVLSPLALGFVAGIAGHMLHQGVDLFRGRPLQQLVWLIAGLLAAMHRLCVADQQDKVLSPTAW